MNDYYNCSLSDMIKALQERVTELENRLEEAERFSIFNFPAGTKVLINGMSLNPKKKQKRNKKN